MGRVRGQRRSRRERLMDISILAYTVFTPKSLPKNKNPRTRSAVFTTEVKSLADHPVTSLTSVEKPVMPPKAK